MTLAQLAPSTMSRNASRWLLFVSLALNLFFIGAALAIFLRPPAPPTWDRNVFVRLERLAAALPPADGSILRSAVGASRGDIDRAQTAYRTAQDKGRGALRQDPFSADALRTASEQTRAAKLAFDTLVQNTVIDASVKMSTEGRRAMADWPPRRKSGN